jgi:riboflavin kinase/FMN adenylyltransferase
MIYRVNSSFDASLFDHASCAFGVFDGVHRGHQSLIDSTRTTALSNGGSAFAVTFDIDPDEIFRQTMLKKLMRNEDRIEYLSQCGVDVVVLPFTERFASEHPNQFLDLTFGNHAPAFLHVGSNLRFGARAEGDTDDLRTWSHDTGMQVCVHDLLLDEGQPISATRIRSLLMKGKIDEANRLLGHRYTLNELVVSGRGDGRSLGFRTANLKVPLLRRVLCEGVYAGYASIDGKKYRAAISVGVSPTFADETTASCEAHILDFDGDLYGRRLKLAFVHHIRPMMHFDSVDELTRTIKDNIEAVRTMLPLD